MQFLPMKVFGYINSGTENRYCILFLLFIYDIVDNMCIIFLIGSIMPMFTFPFFISWLSVNCCIIQDQKFLSFSLTTQARITKISNFILIIFYLYLFIDFCFPFFFYWSKNNGFVKYRLFTFLLGTPTKKLIGICLLPLANWKNYTTARALMNFPNMHPVVSSQQKQGWNSKIIHFFGIGDHFSKIGFDPSKICLHSVLSYLKTMSTMILYYSTKRIFGLLSGLDLKVVLPKVWLFLYTLDLCFARNSTSNGNSFWHSWFYSSWTNITRGQKGYSKISGTSQTKEQRLLGEMVAGFTIALHWSSGRCGHHYLFKLNSLKN